KRRPPGCLRRGRSSSRASPSLRRARRGSLRCTSSWASGVLSEDVLQCIFRRWIGRGFGVLHCVFDLALDLCTQLAVFVFTQRALFEEALPEAVDRIALRPLFYFGARAIPPVVVRRSVRHETVGLRFDELRAVAAPAF